MQIHLPVFSANGLDGVRAYIAASDAYLQSANHRRSMVFSFPDIRRECPLCRGSHCARWKGYYTRGMQDAALTILGSVVVRYGRCMRFKSEFSFLPDFLLPRRRLTLPTLVAVDATHRSGSMTLQERIDCVISPWDEALYAPVSTVHSTLCHLQQLIKSRYVPIVMNRRLRRRLLEPERFVSEWISSLFNVLQRLKMPALSPP